jgi:hypothetical protein
VALRGAEGRRQGEDGEAEAVAPRHRHRCAEGHDFDPDPQALSQMSRLDDAAKRESSTRMPGPGGLDSARPQAPGGDLAVVGGEIHAAACFTLPGDDSLVDHRLTDAP